MPREGAESALFKCVGAGARSRGVSGRRLMLPRKSAIQQTKFAFGLARYWYGPLPTANSQRGAGRYMKLADALVEALVALDVRFVFGVSGANIEHLHDAIHRRGSGRLASVMA